MNSPSSSSDTWLRTNAVLLALAAVVPLLHLASNLVFPYGIFRDEFYYIACSQNLAWGYVDHPPLIALITLIARTAFGESPAGLRFLPSLALGGVVLLTGWMTRDLGGGRFAQLLAAVAVLAGTVYWVVGGILSTIPFDHFFWVLTAYLVVRLLVAANPKYWLVIGVAVGLGLMNKNNMAFLVAGLAVGVLLTPVRKYLLTRWLWLGALLAFILVLPNVWWEITNGFPTLEFIRNAADKNASTGPLSFLGNQILSLNPLTFPLWLAGLVYFLRRSNLCLLAFLYLVPMLILTATRAARVDYLTPAYPVLFAGGAVVFAQWLTSHSWSWAKPVAVGALVLVGLVLLPLGIPVLPPDQMASYLSALGQTNQQLEKGKTALLPQYYADRFGWQEMTNRIAQVYNALTPAERAQAAIFTQNYGEAGALNFYGGALGLPPAISGHNNYFLWGTGNASGNVVIIIGTRNKADFADAFTSVEQVGTFTCDYCTSEENNLPIWLGRGIKAPIQSLWSQIKHYG